MDCLQVCHIGSWWLDLCRLITKTMSHIQFSVSDWYLASLSTHWTSLNIFCHALILLHKMGKLESHWAIILVHGL